MRAPARLFLASSNRGKLAEFRALAASFATGVAIELEPVPEFDSLTAFVEDKHTFAENAIGKALHYSRLHQGMILADDSGLVVPALGGGPGVHSARYAGPNATSADRIAKLLGELRGKKGADRAAHFVCAIAVAENGRAKTIVTGRVDGEISEVPRGSRGFGYDPVFYFPTLKRTFAELSPEEKNLHSHRGKAFRRLFGTLCPSDE